MTEQQEKQTTLEFIETTTATNLPQTTSVERTIHSRYHLTLLTRHYHRLLRATPQFLTYTRPEAGRIQATLEERNSMLGDETYLWALEGAPQRFVDDLVLPRRTYLTAETDGGQLKAEPYHHRQRRNILRVLLDQLGMHNLSLRELLKLDWSSLHSYEEYEPLLRKAKVMGWTEEDIGKRLTTSEGGNVLTLTKRAQFGPILDMAEKYGAPWLHEHTTEQLADLTLYRALRTMGYDEAKTAREMGLGWGRAKEMMEAAQTLTTAEIDALVDRLVDLDRLIKRNHRLGMELYFLNSPIRIRR